MVLTKEIGDPIEQFERNRVNYLPENTTKRFVRILEFAVRRCFSSACAPVIDQFVF